MSHGVGEVAARWPRRELAVRAPDRHLALAAQTCTKPMFPPRLFLDIRWTANAAFDSIRTICARRHWSSPRQRLLELEVMCKRYAQARQCRAEMGTSFGFTIHDSPVQQLASDSCYSVY